MRGIRAKQLKRVFLSATPQTRILIHQQLLGPNNTDDQPREITYRQIKKLYTRGKVK